jgi:hypothetical protein
MTVNFNERLLRDFFRQMAITNGAIGNGVGHILKLSDKLGKGGPLTLLGCLNQRGLVIHPWHFSFPQVDVA